MNCILIVAATILLVIFDSQVMNVIIWKVLLCNTIQKLMHIKYCLTYLFGGLNIKNFLAFF